MGLYSVEVRGRLHGIHKTAIGLIILQLITGAVILILGATLSTDIQDAKNYQNNGYYTRDVQAGGAAFEQSNYAGVPASETIVYDELPVAEPKNFDGVPSPRKESSPLEERNTYTYNTQTNTNGYTYTNTYTNTNTGGYSSFDSSDSLTLWGFFELMQTCAMVFAVPLVVVQVLGIFAYGTTSRGCVITHTVFSSLLIPFGIILVVIPAVSSAALSAWCDEFLDDYRYDDEAKLVCGSLKDRYTVITLLMSVNILASFLAAIFGCIGASKVGQKEFQPHANYTPLQHQPSYVPPQQYVVAQPYAQPQPYAFTQPYGQPQYAQPQQYAQVQPQYAQSQPQYGQPQPQYAQSQPQYGQPQPQYGQPQPQQYAPQAQAQVQDQLQPQAQPQAQAQAQPQEYSTADYTSVV